VTFTPRQPGDGRFGDILVTGIRLQVTDRRVYDPTQTAVRLLLAVQSIHPDRIGWIPRHFDRLAGTSSLREAIVAGRPVEQIVSGWTAALRRFEDRRRPYLLYESPGIPRR
jgi:uncharacterized protein YbbC (DUF1343 family)